MNGDATDDSLLRVEIGRARAFTQLVEQAEVILDDARGEETVRRCADVANVAQPDRAGPLADEHRAFDGLDLVRGISPLEPLWNDLLADVEAESAIDTVGQ